MKTYTLAEPGIRTYGFITDEDGRFARLPRKVVAEVGPGTEGRMHNLVGGRIRFRTDSKIVMVRIRLSTLKIDWAIPLSGSAGADIYVGRGEAARYVKIVAPKNYETFENEASFSLGGELEDVTINLPRNEAVEEIIVSLEDDARLEPPTPYAIETPITFYGSSITEGGCASRPGNAYTSLLGRWLDADYRNLGFSNAARGEQPMAEYIASLPMSALVMDYDHNANNPAQLAETHGPFYRLIRAARPELPILFISKPDFDGNRADSVARRDVIRTTYAHGIADGDKRLWMIDGQTLFGTDNRAACTVDGCHPNDLGFMRMAKTIYPVLKEMLTCK